MTRRRDEGLSNDDSLVQPQLTYIDKLLLMSRALSNPSGQPVQRASASRARRSRPYRNARDEYARIREFRQTNPIAAHLRERRFELGLTQEQVAAAAETSHTAISRLENGSHMPQLNTLRRIAAVLDEELLVCFQRIDNGEVEREFAAVLP